MDRVTWMPEIARRASGRQNAPPVSASRPNVTFPPETGVASGALLPPGLPLPPALLFLLLLPPHPTTIRANTATRAAIRGARGMAGFNTFPPRESGQRRV